MKYKNGKPVQVGDVVHVKNSPYVIINLTSIVHTITMDERRLVSFFYPEAIGASLDQGE